MQKLEYVRALAEISKQLKSPSIVAEFDRLSSLPLTSSSSSKSIATTLFDYKSTYDRLFDDGRYRPILEILNSDGFDSSVFLKLVLKLSTGINKSDIFLDEEIYDFYQFNKFLITHYELANSLLDNKNLSDLDTTADGVIVFQIIIDEDGLDPAEYGRIFLALNELASTIAHLHDEDTESKIILLDSGSDSFIGLKTGVETARSLFQIFKEVWDFLVNRKRYEEKMNQQSLSDTLSTLQLIEQMRQNNTLSDAEAQLYRHHIVGFPFLERCSFRFGYKLFAINSSFFMASSVSSMRF